MIFTQFYLESLGHASYFVGSQETGEALVLDARRDVDIYFEAARQQGMRIRYAIDTHQHNDYLTGICELPARGNVQLLAGARAALGYHVRKMDDGERVDEVPDDQPVAVICGSGYRSSVAASILQRRGDQVVINILGGMGAWTRAGLETVTDHDQEG
jgi:hydroxyacylglutathione hydrolase